ncbi:MAG: hypothetical protein IT521_02975 [Burkholderiales bacterium]|nr:hypothetical protein [Burkholderiales bacterium]
MIESASACAGTSSGTLAADQAGIDVRAVAVFEATHAQHVVELLIEQSWMKSVCRIELPLRQIAEVLRHFNWRIVGFAPKQL